MAERLPERLHAKGAAKRTKRTVARAQGPPKFFDDAFACLQ
jgi:hypothetical protein